MSSCFSARARWCRATRAALRPLPPPRAPPCMKQLSFQMGVGLQGATDIIELMLTAGYLCYPSYLSKVAISFLEAVPGAAPNFPSACIVDSGFSRRWASFRRRASSLQPSRCPRGGGLQDQPTPSRPWELGVLGET